MKVFLVPVLLLLLLTLPKLGQGDFRRDTVRYAAVSHYMWSGGSLLTPYLTVDKPYFNKPPMALWIHGLFLKLFGRNLSAARLPSILAALGILALSMAAVANLGSANQALTSGFVLAGTYEFFRRTREISLDLWQLFFIMLAVWLLSKAVRDERKRWIVLAGVPIGLGLLCKPLVALAAIPLFAIWLVLRGHARWIGWVFLGALPLALLVAAPWHLYMYRTFGTAFFDRYLVAEVVERAQRSDQPTTLLFYLKLLALTYWPWLLGIGYAAWLATRKQIARTDVTALGAIWAGLALVALSLFADRKPNYALPLYPMLAWIAAGAIGQAFNLQAWLARNFWRVAAGLALLFFIVELAPIRFQQPAEEHSLALVEWMRAQQIDPAQMMYERVEPQDVSYVYIKTGKWMRDARVVDQSPNEPGRLVLTKFAGENKPKPEQGVLFHSGPFYVLKAD